MLLDLLSNILELPYQLVLNEAQKKLQYTYMVVNGELKYIKELSEGCMLVSDGKNNSLYADNPSDYDTGTQKIESLEVWLPETGISFTSPDSRVLLYKFPEKQWRKSFCFDFYQISSLDLDIENFEIPFLIYKNGILPTQKPYLFRGRVYYLDKQIGTVDKEKKSIINKPNLYITDGRFFQESYEEFSKDFNVCQKN